MQYLYYQCLQLRMYKIKFSFTIQTANIKSANYFFYKEGRILLPHSVSFRILCKGGQMKVCRTIGGAWVSACKRNIFQSHS